MYVARVAEEYKMDDDVLRDSTFDFDLRYMIVKINLLIYYLLKYPYLLSSWFSRLQGGKLYVLLITLLFTFTIIWSFTLYELCNYFHLSLRLWLENVCLCSFKWHWFYFIVTFNKLTHFRRHWFHCPLIMHIVIAVVTISCTHLLNWWFFLSHSYVLNTYRMTVPLIHVLKLFMTAVNWIICPSKDTKVRSAVVWVLLSTTFHNTQSAHTLI